MRDRCCFLLSKLVGRKRAKKKNTCPLIPFASHLLLIVNQIQGKPTHSPKPTECQTSYDQKPDENAPSYWQKPNRISSLLLAEASQLKVSANNDKGQLKANCQGIPVWQSIALGLLEPEHELKWPLVDL